MRNNLKSVALTLLAALLCALLVTGVFCALSCGKSGEFLFNALLQAGPVMSWMFALMFLLGLSVTLERLWFFIERLPFFIRLILKVAATSPSPTQTNSPPAEGCPKGGVVLGDAATTRSRADIVNTELDGHEPDFGAGLLEFIAGIAPVLGFIGTLIGFMRAFDSLGVGARLVSVLYALSYSMNTSLLGAAISLLFLVMAFFLRRTRALLDAQFQQPLTKERK